jgi:diguanylate cyclase (GGDEF)-like protein/PAS domain S-box-containing protein
MSSLFELLPIGAYRSSVSGRMLRANAALVRLNGYTHEGEMIAAVNDIAQEWYVDPARRAEFQACMEKNGAVVDFVSEIYRHKSRERIWIRETAHTVRDPHGAVLYYEGTVEDITATHKVQLALQDSEQLLREITAQVPGMLYRIVFVPGFQGRYTYVSSGVIDLYGIEPQDVLSNSAVLRNMRHPEDRDRVAAAVGDSVKNKTALDIEFRVILPDGSLKWLQMKSICVDAGPEGQIRNGVMLDITAGRTAQAALEQAEDRWKLALESTGDGVWDWHILEGKEYYSQRCREMYGFAHNQPWDRAEAYDGIVHPDDNPQRLLDLYAYLNNAVSTYSNEHRVRCADGSWKWVLSRGMVISRDKDGAPVRMIGTHTDITQRKDAELMIWRQANFDALTGLPNRRLLRERLNKAMKVADVKQTPLAVIFLDLDEFKEVNDTLGHEVGDHLLIEASRRIEQCLQPTDTLARMGGDEFTIVVVDAGDEERMGQQLTQMLQAIGQPFQLRGEQVFVTASIGVAFYPNDAEVIEDLFKHADQALYVAKNNGRNRFSFFTPALQAAAQTRMRLATDLRTALSNRELFLVYQPIIELASGQVLKAEALLRWNHPQRGLINPAEFIPIAETTGQIIDIGEWVFQEAARQVDDWRRRFCPDFQISINKSPVQFHAPVAHTVSWPEQLANMGLSGAALAVEITEGVLLNASDAITQHLQALRACGMAVSLDDFGTGYSSLTYLQRYAIDFIKIDQSFVRNLHQGSTSLALCKALIVLAHELGMKVVAEGIETIEQRDLLLAAGCDCGQGYWFSKPLSAADFESFCAAL